MKNLLSFDVEEYFHGPAYSHVPSDRWGTLESRITDNMAKLMSILGRQRATFFVMGWVAERYPTLLKEFVKDGHEIACHGHMHRHIWDLSPEEFRDDLTLAKARIEENAGIRIIGFRAPTFSITKSTYWALEIIRDVGFKYDSSIFPIHHDRYGIPSSPRLPYKMMNDLWEIPLSTVRIFGHNMPFGGGGYFRLYPYWLTEFLIGKINHEGAPFIFYQHPWELDRFTVAKPKSFVSWLRRNLITGSPESKLKRLLDQYEFVPVKVWLNGVQK